MDRYHLWKSTWLGDTTVFALTDEEHHGKTCRCDGYWFPHRRGSKFCGHNPNPPSEVEWELHPAMR